MAYLLGFKRFSVTKVGSSDYKEQNVTTYHGMRELPEYKELCKRYDEEEKKLEQYREECKNKAFDLFSEWFYSLWD